MGDVEIIEDENNENILRRSRRLALTEINEVGGSNIQTPVKSTNADEMVIIQRGPRRKPIIWSPVDYDRSRILAPPRERTPEKVPKKCEINPRLRRRLTLSPTKNTSQELGIAIAKRLRALKNLDKE